MQIRCTCRILRCTDRGMVEKRLRRLRGRRLSPIMDRPRQPGANDFGMRSGRDRDAEWRGDMEVLVQPADRTVLSRSDGQPISILGLRSAAGQRRGGDSEPEQLAGAEFYGLAANGSGRRERLHRARSSTSGNYLRRNGGAAGFTQRAGTANAADTDV